MKLQRIETPDYILAVSDKKIKERDLIIINGNIKTVQDIDEENNEIITDGKYDYVFKPNQCKLIISYQPKNNAPELELPLLPEIVVEDDVQNFIAPLLKKKGDENNRIDLDAYARGLIDGYISATKVYSEEDLRKAFEKGFTVATYLADYETEKQWNEFIKSLKQPKPKWFVAETEYDCCNRYQNCKGCDATAEMINLRLKTTTINGKTYLVGTYLYE
jgi:hypothetical protein